MTSHLLSPIVFISVLLIAIGVIVYQEYRSLSGKKLQKRRVSPDLKEFLQNNTLFSPSTYEEDSVIDFSSQDTSGAEYPPIQKELINFQFVLNPVRLAILKVVHRYTTYESSQIRDELGITWGKYTSHLNALEEKGYVETLTEFIETQHKKVVSITSYGIAEFEKLVPLLENVVS